MSDIHAPAPPLPDGLKTTVPDSARARRDIRKKHVCALYAGTDELLQNCVAMARDALVSGLKSLFVFDGVVARLVHDPLAQALSQTYEVAGAELLFGPRPLPISVEASAEKLRNLAESAVGEGYEGLFAVIDMSWMLDAPSGLANHGELEAALHELTQKSQIMVACLYNRLTFPANMQLDVLRTHSEVYENGEARGNPHYLPPEVFLSGDPQRKVDWWLSTLSGEMYPGTAAAPPVTPAAKKAGIEAKRARARQRPVRLAAARGITNFPHGHGGTVSGTEHRWKIRCFGDLRVYSGDSSQIQWNRSSGATYKTKTLFAYLLQKGPAGASVEETADLLWPEAHDLDQSLNRLYHTIHCLRMALSPELTSSRHSPFVVSSNRRYRLALPEGTWIDVPVFEQFCRQGEKLLHAGDLNQSLVCHLAAERLYTGSLFEDIPVEYVEDPSRDWCWSKRFWLEEIHLKMLTNLATIYRRRNDLKHAIYYCERVLEADPCLESAHREAMRIYHMIGRRDALERQFRMCRESLKRFEDRPPSAETTALARELMA